LAPKETGGIYGVQQLVSYNIKASTFTVKYWSALSKGNPFEDFAMVRTPVQKKMAFRTISYRTLIRNAESRARNSSDRLRTGPNDIKA
jgi:hypothetical protein